MASHEQSKIPKLRSTPNSPRKSGIPTSIGSSVGKKSNFSRQSSMMGSSTGPSSKIPKRPQAQIPQLRVVPRKVVSSSPKVQATESTQGQGDFACSMSYPRFEHGMEVPKKEESEPAPPPPLRLPHFSISNIISNMIASENSTQGLDDIEIPDSLLTQVHNQVEQLVTESAEKSVEIDPAKLPEELPTGLIPSACAAHFNGGSVVESEEKRERFPSRLYAILSQDNFKAVDAPPIPENYEQAELADKLGITSESEPRVSESRHSLYQLHHAELLDQCCPPKLASSVDLQGEEKEVEAVPHPHGQKKDIQVLLAPKPTISRKSIFSSAVEPRIPSNSYLQMFLEKGSKVPKTAIETQTSTGLLARNDRASGSDSVLFQEEESFRGRELPEDYPETESDGSCETDYSCYYQGGEDDEEANDETLLSTKINLKLQDSNRRTKTIFSVDLPMSQTKIESGPGENGDGLEVHPSAKSASSKNMGSSAKPELEILLPKRSETGKRISIAELLSSSKISVERDSQEEELRAKCPMLSVIHGGITILSSMGCTSTTTLGSTQSEKKFNLILQRSSMKLEKEFRKNFRICNSTSHTHGYKIWCNSAANSHLVITPSSGTIPALGEVSIEVCTRNPKGLDNQINLAKDKIEVSVFRTYCSDHELHEYYNKLREQRPDLITVQSIQRIILWDAGNVAGRLELLNSIPDNERDSLKDELHRSQTDFGVSASEESVGGCARSSYLLTTIKNQLIVTDGNLMGAMKEMASIKQAQQSIFLCFILFFTCCVIMPFLNSDVKVADRIVAPPPEEQGTLAWIKDFLRTCGGYC